LSSAEYLLPRLAATRDVYWSDCGLTGSVCLSLTRGNQLQRFDAAKAVDRHRFVANGDAGESAYPLAPTPGAGGGAGAGLTTDESAQKKAAGEAIVCSAFLRTHRFASRHTLIDRQRGKLEPPAIIGGCRHR
jgi:hypothetical protein